jgi:hypothetical protein
LKLDELDRELRDSALEDLTAAAEVFNKLNSKPETLNTLLVTREILDQYEWTSHHLGKRADHSAILTFHALAKCFEPVQRPAVCLSLVGALYAAILKSTPKRPRNSSKRKFMIVQACRAVETILSRRGHIESSRDFDWEILDWHSAPGRTREDVLVLLDDAIRLCQGEEFSRTDTP